MIVALYEWRDGVRVECAQLELPSLDNPPERGYGGQLSDSDEQEDLNNE